MQLVEVRSDSYRRDIDGLRFVSIVLVVLYHAGVEWFAGGYVGVDVFFVLSGYLITGLLVRERIETGGIDIVGFFARRIRRLLPLAAIVMLTTLVVGGWLLAPLQRSSLITDARWASLYAANWRYGSQATAYSDTEVTDSLLLHYWSLSIEEQFYFFWPLVVLATVWAVRRFQSANVRTVLLVPAGVITALSLGFAVLQAQQGAGGAYFSSFGRFWEMGVGALLAITLPRVPSRRAAVSNAFQVLGLAAILVSALTYSNATAFPGYAALLPVIGTAMVVVGGERSNEHTERASGQADLLGWGPLPGLGRLSYGWYLWHWPMIGFALLMRDRWDLPGSSDVAIAVAVFVSLAASWMTYHLIENPIRHARRLRASAPPSFALGAALMLTPIIGGAIYVNVGDVGGSVVAIPDLASADSEAADAPAADAPAADTSTAPTVGSNPAIDGDLATTSPTTTTTTPLVATTLLIQAMTPEQAADDWIGRDRPKLRIPECINNLEEIAVADASNCVLGDPNGQQTLIALGDSHLQHLLPGLHLAGEKNGWRILAWVKSSCPINATPLWVNQFERAYSECTEWMADLFDYLETLTADGVILGRSFKYFDEVVDESGQLIEDPELAAAAWGDGHGAVHARLTEMFGGVVVVRDTPFVGQNAATCLSDNIDTPQECAISDAANITPDDVLYRAEVAAVGEPHHYDLVPYICDTNPCQLVTGGGVIKFRDWSHLTGTFSTSLEPVFADMIGGLLAER